jgi:Flp pilus assembly protein TadG
VASWAARVSTRERGGAAVEFALIAPLLLMLVFGIADFGWMLMKANLVNSATRDAARVASLAGTYDEIEDSVEVSLASAGIDVDDVDVTITCTNASGPGCADSPASYDANVTSGSVVTVTVSYTHSWITPMGAMCGLFADDSCVGDTIVLERTSQMVRE